MYVHDYLACLDGADRAHAFGSIYCDWPGDAVNKASANSRLLLTAEFLPHSKSPRSSPAITKICGSVHVYRQDVL